MRVVFLTHNFPAHADDPAGSFLLRLALALRDVGVAVRVVAPAGGDAPSQHEVQGIRVRRFRYAPRGLETIANTGTMAADVKASWGARFALGGLLFAGARALRAEVRAFDADVAHCHWWFPSGLSAVVPGARAGRPLVVTSHGSDVRLARTVPGAPALMRRVAHTTREWTFVSSWLRDEAAALSWMPNATVAPMPVATSTFAPPPSDATRQGLLFVGRLNAQKGIADLLRALPATTSDVPLSVVGDGPESGAMRALADSLGIAARVRWLGTRPQPSLAALYASAQALVVPSTDEGLGLVAVEAQLTETPVIAYASGGLTDVVRHERNGLLVPVGDTVALGTAIDRVVGDASLARALGAAGRVDALDRFSPIAVASAYRAVYERAVASRGAARE